MDILDSERGKERYNKLDLDWYVLIAENIVDIEILSKDKLQGLVPEYTDVTEYSEERKESWQIK